MYFVEFVMRRLWYSLITVALLLSIVVIVNAANGPCMNGTTEVCTSCTCFDVTEHGGTTGGTFFNEVFYRLPLGWMIVDNVNGKSWSLQQGVRNDWGLNGRNLVHSGADPGWYMSPVIETDLASLEDLRLTITVERADASFVMLKILPNISETAAYFSDAYLENLISVNLSTIITNVTINATLLAPVFDTFGHDFPLHVGFHDIDLKDYIGQKIRIALFSNSDGLIYVDDLTLHYQMQTIFETPTTDDYSLSPPCCGGHHDISVFVPGHMWGGYTTNCDGYLSAVDFYIYEVDVQKNSVKGRTIVLQSDTDQVCHGSWNNSLTFNETLHTWTFGTGIPIDSQSDCLDLTSEAIGTLCLGSQRPSLCGKTSCGHSFYLRRSEKPNDQFLYIYDLNVVNEVLGTMENRWTAIVAVSNDNVVFALDDFGRVHYEPRSNDTHEDIVFFGISSGIVVYKTRDGNLYSLGLAGSPLLGRGENSPGFPPSLIKYIPPIERIWISKFSILAQSKQGEMWGWGLNEGNLGYESVERDVYYPVPLFILNLKQFKIAVGGEIRDIALGDAHLTLVGANDKLYICGYNAQSELGLGTTITYSEPTLHHNLFVKHCGCGAYHTICTTVDGHQVGFGTAVIFSSPIPEPLYHLVGLNITSTKCYNHLNVATIDDGSVYTWGLPVGKLGTLPMIVRAPKMISGPNFHFFQAVPGPQIVALIRDNDIGVTYANGQNVMNVSESDGLVEIVIDRSSDNIDPLSLDVSSEISHINRRSIEINSSYELLNGTVEWNAGEGGSKSIYLAVENDNIYDGPFVEVVISLSRPGVNTKSLLRVRVYDDGDAGKLCFVNSYLTILENEGILSVKINRTAQSSGEIVAHIEHIAGKTENKAVNDNEGDFRFFPLDLIWLDQDNIEKVINVNINNDRIYELDESFALKMTVLDGSTSFDKGCDEVNVIIIDDFDGGIFMFNIKNQTATDVFISIERTTGKSGHTSLFVAPVNNVNSVDNLAESGIDYSIPVDTINFKDQDQSSKFIHLKLNDPKSSEKIVILQVTKNGTGVLLNKKNELHLRIPIGELDEGHSNSTVLGVVFGCLGAAAVIGALLLYRAHKSHKERLRDQWLIPYNDLADLNHSEGRVSSTATYVGSLVFVENMHPHMTQQNEETFTQYVVLHHANLVTFIGVCFDPPLLVTEYCHKGGLDEALEDGKIPFLTDFKASLCSDSAQGMAYLHAKGISHGMLDLSKLVINSRFVCKISGLALQPWHVRNIGIDIVCWLAPEQLVIIGPQTMNEEEENDIFQKLEKSDIQIQLCDLYSFGMIIFAIFTENPFPYTEQLHTVESWRFKREALRINIINNSARPEMPPDLTDPNVGMWKSDSKEMKTMEQAQRCWANEPIMRPPFQELVSFFHTMLPAHAKLVEDMHNKYLEHMEELVANRTNELRKEKDDTENILSKIHTLIRNVIPEHIVERLQNGDKVIADKYDNVTIFYSEIVNFVEYSLEVSNIVNLLNGMFSRIDSLAAENEVERVKTIGDSYVAMCGAPTVNENHEEQMLLFALDVVEETFEITPGQICELRIGIDTGPVCSGVIGAHRIAYDVWGPSVSKAQSICRIAPEKRVCVSQIVYEKLRNVSKFTFVDGPATNHDVEGLVYVAMPLFDSNKESVESIASKKGLGIGSRTLGRREKMLAVKKMLMAASIVVPGEYIPHSPRCQSVTSGSSCAKMRRPSNVSGGQRGSSAGGNRRRVRYKKESTEDLMDQKMGSVDDLSVNSALDNSSQV